MTALVVTIRTTSASYPLVALLSAAEQVYCLVTTGWARRPWSQHNSAGKLRLSIVEAWGQLSVDYH